MMKRSTLFLGLLISALLACEKDDAKPYADLPETVRATIDMENCMCDTKLGLFRWNDQLLYHPYTTHPGCNMMSVFYDQEGNEVELDAEERQNFLEEAERLKVWNCGEK